jgi:3-oxoacyl-[acyl-carrier protein] reductase
MDMALTGKRALITGSSTGLGRAIAEMLAAEGTSVVVHGRDRDRTDAVAGAIRDAGGTARSVVGDLATADGARSVAEGAGEVDILVNNAGTYDGLRWKDLTDVHWMRIFETNVVSGTRMIEHLVPGMRSRGWGRVVTIGGGLARHRTRGVRGVVSQRRRQIRPTRGDRGRRHVPVQRHAD